MLDGTRISAQGIGTEFFNQKSIQISSDSLHDTGAALRIARFLYPGDEVPRGSPSGGRRGFLCARD